MESELALSMGKNSGAGGEDVLECSYRILELVRTGVIDPKNRVGEASLTSELGTARSTVRAALDHLEVSGLVERVPRSGTFFRTISIKKLSDGMDVRAALEALAARQAAIQASDAEFSDLRERAAHVDSLNKLLVDGDNSCLPALMESDRAFHLRVAELSGNRLLPSVLEHQRIIEQSYLAGIRDQYVYRPRKDRPVPTHVEIVDALCSGDPHVAEETMRRHILRTKEIRLGAFTGDSA